MIARLAPAALICAMALAPAPVRAGGEAMPGPARSPRRPSAAAENAACEGCHREIAAEWRASLHRRAHTDPAYQRALAIEPLPFCRGCHAPEADPAADPPADLASIGVGCVTCHITSGPALAAPREGAPPAPHPISRSPAFAGASACAACHEFSFPDPERRTQRELMQSTASEHRASPFAAMACAGCHMPVSTGEDGRPHRSHRFLASRDPAFLRSGARVTAARIDGGAVEVRIAAAGVGHAFPSGDLFRRLAVHAEAVGAESQVVAEDTRYLARRFGKSRGLDGHPIKVLTADTRVPGGGESRVRLSLGSAAAGLPIAWQVVYQRVEHPINDGSDAAVVEGEVEIASGVIR